MSLWHGVIDPSGSPRIKISVYGINKTLAQEFDALIDTGFSGFLSMHMVQAFPLGLVLSGTTSVTLADGSQVANLTAMGCIEIGGEIKTGLILLENNPCDILIGMDFLRTFSRVLLVHPVQGLTLVDQAFIDDLAEKARQAQEAQQALTHPPTSGTP
jgi:predicted aspartyl protease